MLLYRLIQEIKFDQEMTRYWQLVDFTVNMFEKHRVSSDNAQLLLILSDGIQVCAEGREPVISAIKRARLANIFLVFIVIDNPKNSVILNNILK